MAHILIVEDDIDRQKWFMHHCYGHYTRYAQDKRKALEILDSEEFDIVFLDHDLGKSTSIEIAEKIKRLPPQLPMVIIHSCNPVGSKNLKRILPEAYICPFTKLKSSLRNFLNTDYI